MKRKGRTCFESSVPRKRLCTRFIVASLILTFYSPVSQAADEYDTAADEAGIFQGKIVEIVEDDLVIQLSEGKVRRVPLPGETGMSVADFRVGELIEITITPGGVTTSVIPVQGAFEP